MITSDQLIELLEAVRDHTKNVGNVDLSLNHTDAANLIAALVTTTYLIPDSTWPEKFVRDLAASFHIEWV